MAVDFSVKGKRMKKPKIVIITVVITLVAVLLLGAIIRGKGKGQQKGKVVRLEAPSRGELIEFVSAPGQIEPKTSVEISAKVSARIIELPYAEGDRVTCGNEKANPPAAASVVIRLDSKDLESRLTSAQASRAAQAAQMEVEKARIASQEATLVGVSVSLKQAQRDLKRKIELLQ